MYTQEDGVLLGYYRISSPLIPGGGRKGGRSGVNTISEWEQGWRRWIGRSEKSRRSRSFIGSSFFPLFLVLF